MELRFKIVLLPLFKERSSTKQTLRKIQFVVMIVFMALSFTLACLTFVQAASASGAADPLPSWKNGPSKQVILQFIQEVTDKLSPNYVPSTDRIATFDNDGTLWSERPVYFQLLFAIDRVKALAPKHPEWKTRQPFEAVLNNNMKALAASGEKGVIYVKKEVLLRHVFEKQFADFVQMLTHL